MSKRAKMEEEQDLECPICIKHLLPPVYQCHEGHLLCKDCIEKTRNICPTCKDRMPPQKIRNRAIEDIIRSRLHPCRNYDEGCRERLKFDALDNHEFDCFYSEHRFCNILKMENCAYPMPSVKRIDLKEHFKAKHQISFNFKRNLGEEFHMVDKIPQERVKSKPHWGSFSLRRPSGPPLFVLVKVWHQRNQTLWVPYIIGSRDTANLYECTINLTGKVKMSWSGVFRDLQSTKEDVYACFTVSAECLRGIIMEGRQDNSYDITVRVSARDSAED